MFLGWQFLSYPIISDNSPFFTDKEQHARQLDAFHAAFAGSKNGITENHCIVFANTRSGETRDRRSYAKLCT